MTTATKQRTKAQHSKNGHHEAKRKAFINDLGNVPLLGELVCWQVKQNTSFKTVKDSLSVANLNTEVARELMPQHAFTRAAKKLTDERVIDILRNESDKITFQLTKRVLENDEWAYYKDTFLVLNKTTGKVTCAQQQLENKAQNALDEAIEERTTNDITKIVQKLFDAEADLFRIRDEGGVYFVPQQHTAFTEKVENFLTGIGGRLNRFPVPANTRQGNLAVQNAVESGMSQIIADHEAAVANFSLDTRATTLQNTAERIKTTRVKIEAYANYLADKRDALLQACDTADQKLANRIAELTEERKNAPPSERHGSRGHIFSFSVTAVMRWMGKMGWNKEETRRVIDKMGCGDTADNTINCQLLAGRKGERGEPAALTEDQMQELEDLRKEKV